MDRLLALLALVARIKVLTGKDIDELEAEDIPVVISDQQVRDLIREILA